MSIETYLGETKDFSSIITKIRATSPEAVFVAGLYNEAALICKQSKAVGWEPAFFGVDALYEESLINLGGLAVENFRINAFFHPMVDDPLVKEFVTEYETLYNAFWSLRLVRTRCFGCYRRGHDKRGADRKP